MMDVQNSSNKWEVSSFHSDDEVEEHQEKSKPSGNTRVSANGNAKMENHTENKNGRKSNHRLTRTLWKVFASQTSTPPGGKVTPVDDDSVDEPPKPLKAFTRSKVHHQKMNPSVKDKVENISLNSFKEDLPRREATSHYANPVFAPTDLENENAIPEIDRKVSNKKSYPAPIYSVNSAGRPVPITIEESENEQDDTDDVSCVDGEFGLESRSEFSESPQTPSAYAIFSRQECCCLSVNKYGSFTSFLIKIWRKTYLPSSAGIFVWLCILTAAFLYNLWSIPLRAAFFSEIQTPGQNVWFAFDAICDFIYVVDIFIKFRTCFIQSGVFVTDPDLLNRYHRREWTLILDILSILPTDLFFLQLMNPYFRVNRVFKFHRVFKFYQFGELSTWSPNFWRSINLLHIFFVVIHYNACLYYSLSSANGFGALLTSWAYPNPEYFPEYQSFHRRYTYSFYWCMVGLGLVNDRYFPETDWQFVFSIYLHFLGLTFLVVFIGFFTVVIFGNVSQKFKFERTIRTTNDYMKQRKLPKDLRTRVLRFYQYSWLSEQFPHLDEENALRSLPLAVKQEIEIQANSNALKQVSCLARYDEKILRDLVMKLQRTIYLPGQFVYKSGDIGKEVYIVGDGILQIVHDGDPTVHTLRDGDVFGEIDFLYESERRRTADVVSYGYSEIFILGSDDVWDTLKKYPKFINTIYHQDRRRRNGNSHFRECQAFGGRYQSVPTSSVKSRDSKLSTSKVHFQVSSAFPGSSPDSGMPSTPSMGPSYHGDSPTVMYQDRRKSDVSEKIAGVYQDHVKSLKASLDSIWYQEIAYLNQRLEDTERERDAKARELSRMKRTVAKTPNGISTATDNNQMHKSDGGSTTVISTTDNQKSGNST